MTDLIRASSDEQLVAVWLLGKSEHTQRSYLAASESFRAFAGDLGSVRLETIYAWIEHLRESGYAESTVRQRVACVKSLLSFAEKTGYIQFNVGAAVAVPGDHRNPAERILSELEVEKIFDELDGRDLLLIQVLYITGVRVSELVGMRWKHCHENDRGASVFIVGKGDKPRRVDIPSRLWVRLQRTRADSEWVWPSRQGGHLTERRVHQVLAEAAESIGIEGVSPHWLRHSCATHALNRGAPIHIVQKKLGHASLTTTEIYANLLPGDSLADFLPEL